MFHEGQQIGQYVLIRKLGKGGFGEVWLAEKRSQFVTKRVAVKLPLDEQVNFDAIRQEAELWEQASGHANVLPIIDADEFDGQVVIVSEYADGGSLHDKLKTEGKLPVKQAVEMTIGILNGLEFLHNKRIIHRDIKPQNILLQGDTPRLADFGISRAMQTTAISSTIIGTDAYMSPEAFDGKRSVQSDIWSVGIVFYQLLKGSLPFPQENPSEKMYAILQREFEPLPNDIPLNLQKIIVKSLAKLPENRYQTTSEMREDLHRILHGEAVSDFIQSESRQTFPAEQITLTQKVAPFSAQSSQDENETVVRSAPNFGQSEKRESSNVWKYATLGLLLLSLVGVSIYFLSRQSQQTDVSKNQLPQNSNRTSNSANTVINSNQARNSSNAPSANSANNTNVNTSTPAPSPTPIVIDEKVIWDDFYAKFVSAVNAHDKKALMQMMPNDFSNPAELTASEWLQDLDKSGGWRGLQESFAQGTVVDKNWTIEGRTIRVTKDDFYYFEFRKNKKWYFSGEVGFGE